MGKERILYCGYFNLPDLDAAAIRVTTIGLLLDACGYDVEFWGNTSTQFKNHNSIPAKKHGRWSAFLRRLFAYKYLRDLVTSAAGNIKMIILYNYPAVPSLLAIPLCKKHGIELAVDCTEWYGWNSFSGVLRIPLWLDSILRMRLVNHMILKRILVSDLLLDYYSRSPGLNINIPPLVNMTDAKWQLGSKGSLKKEIVISYSGSPAKKERLDLLVEALADLNNETSRIKFCLIGMEKNQLLELYPWLKNCLSRINAMYYGKVPHKKAVELLKTSHFSVIIRNSTRSNNAGFPTKLGESMALGVPVITSSLYGFSERITNEVNGYLLSFPLKKDKLKIVLEKITAMSDPEYEEMSKRARFEIGSWLDLSKFNESVKKFIDCPLRKKDCNAK